MRAFYGRLTVVPWGVVIAGLSIISGLVGLLHVGTGSDALDAELAPLLVSAFQVTYLVSGLAMFVGLGRGSASLEGFGLVLLALSIVVRFVAVTAAVGVSIQVVILLVFYVLILWACLTRLRALFRGDVLIRARRHDVVQP